MNIVSGSLLAILTLSSAACRLRDDADTEAIELTADSSSASQSEAALLATTLEGAASASVAPATPQSAAAFIASRAAERYSPSGCITATQTQTRVTLTFAQCTGPRGLRQLDGTLALDVAAGTGGAIVVTASADGFEIGDAVLDLDATATYSVAGAQSTLAVTTRTSGVGSLGHAIAHSGDYGVTWDASCVTVDGAWSSERGDASRSTTASVMRCLDQCPTGTVTRTTIARGELELSFDGTATAQWSSANGRSGTFNLACGR